ncbi:MAG TPA: ATP-binding protein [bacterium]|nr:ATP-binding protein [bacterium]
MDPKPSQFKGSVLAELVSRTLFVGVVILFVYGSFTYFISKKTFDEEMGDRLIAIARLTTGQLRSDWLPFLTEKGELYGKFRQFLVQKKNESQARNIFISDSSGHVLADANGQFEFQERNWLLDLDREPFQKALAGTPSVSILFPENDGGIYKIGYSPIFRDGQVIGVLGVEANAHFMDGLNRFAKVLFSLGLICLLLMGGLLLAFGRRFILPIEEMAKASQRISEGDFSQRVSISSTNELGALAYAFNEMTQRLQSHNEYILESMSNGLLVLDLNGIVTSFNQAASEILGLGKDRVLGGRFEDVFKDVPVFLRALQEAQLRHQVLENREINLSEEEPKFLQIRSAPLLGPDSRELGTEVLFTDETPLRKLQTRIKTAEKMATIGELAAGIAHEIRNPLGAMKGFTEILQKKVVNVPGAKEMVMDIASEIEILNKIVTNFLVFAKPTAVDAQDADLAEAVAGVVPLVEQEAAVRKVTLHLEKGNGMSLPLDVDQFRRAMLNLALNAVQASPPGSEVWIVIREFSRPALAAFLKREGWGDPSYDETVPDWAMVSVQDRGPGMNPESLKRLFTPFFTTKTEGFGLGLSITKKIVEALGGTVIAANRPGGGAQFAILLPLGETKEEGMS